MRHDGAFIKRAVRAMGMSQGDFAAKLGLSRNHVITLFKQTEWDAEYKRDAEKILGIKVGDFNAGSGQNVITESGNKKEEIKEDVENKTDYYKGQVEILKELLKKKEEQLAEALRAQHSTLKKAKSRDNDSERTEQFG